MSVSQNRSRSKSPSQSHVTKGFKPADSADFAGGPPQIFTLPLHGNDNAMRLALGRHCGLTVPSRKNSPHQSHWRFHHLLDALESQLKLRSPRA